MGQWTSEAGPIQTSRVKDKIMNVHNLSKRFKRKTGIRGVDESIRGYTEPFCTDPFQMPLDMLEELGKKHNWTITKKNHEEIKEACRQIVKDCLPHIPIRDETVTQEEHDERMKKINEQRKKQEEESKKWGKSEYMSCKQVAELVRAELRKNFPGQKFSVRSDTYSMGASVCVKWTDGPVASVVKQKVKCFQGSGFDCMIDMKYHYDSWLLPDGTAIIAKSPGTTGSRGTCHPVETERPCPEARLVHFSADHVTCDREVSPERDKELRKLFKERYGRDYDARERIDSEYMREIDAGHTADAPCESSQKATANCTTQGDGFTVRPGQKPGFVEVLFPTKPDASVIRELKAARFRFARRGEPRWWGLESRLPERFKAAVKAGSDSGESREECPEPKPEPEPEPEPKPKPVEPSPFPRIVGLDTVKAEKGIKNKAEDDTTWMTDGRWMILKEHMKGPKVKTDIHGRRVNQDMLDRMAKKFGEMQSVAAWIDKCVESEEGKFELVLRSGNRMEIVNAEVFTWVDKRLQWHDIHISDDEAESQPVKFFNNGKLVGLLMPMNPILENSVDTSKAEIYDRKPEPQDEPKDPEPQPEPEPKEEPEEEEKIVPISKGHEIQEEQKDTELKEAAEDCLDAINAFLAHEAEKTLHVVN